MKKIILLSVLFWTTIHETRAQQTVATTSSTTSIKQKVRGQVVDAESKQPLPGVVVVLVSDNAIATSTDANGYFILEQIPVGRQSFQFTMTGYETYNIVETPVNSGKETELNVSLKENLKQLEEVTVKTSSDRTKPMNEFAAVSARSFSVEETRRYAASFSDPARMAQNFPGVSNNGDMDNSIVVRGNSPKGILWRLEGIEIPNPNHFSSLGTTGGAISMLNANVLGNSDFYTGAFPAEYGNALSGAFDLNFRNGNTQRREHSVQVGALGIELATEGPFSKNSKASYLFNYRYSTTALLKHVVSFGTSQPDYQDLSFKINIPTKRAGTFSMFGLGGYNIAVENGIADSSKWKDDISNISYDARGKTGVAGISHQYFLNKNTYIKTILSTSYEGYKDKADTFNAYRDYQKDPVSYSKFANTAYRLSTMYNQKVNSRNTLRAGIVAQALSYDFNYNYYDKNDAQWKEVLAGAGNTSYYQAYAQWKSRLTERFSLTGGLHGSYLALNGKSSIEPRIAAEYNAGKNRFSMAAGLHSKPEHTAIYLYEDKGKNGTERYPNKNLDLQRALHVVAGYNTVLPGKLRFKTEVYYQHLYNIGIEKDSNKSFSLVNSDGVYNMISTSSALESTGTGRNYGIDISVERPFANNYYFLASGSLYRSTYKDYSGNEYHTKFDRGYQLNLIGGKEFRIGHSGKKTLGLNGKLLYSGGLRESLIDIDHSRATGETQYVPGEYFTQRAPAYFRADMSAYYKFNTKKATHTILLELQNFTNRQNYYFSYFDAETGNIKRVNQLGILPNISYRIDFNW